MARSIGIGAVVLLSAGVAWCGQARAEVTIETVPVGNPGNPDDTHGDGYGGVDYFYNIGKFEVTAGQYAEFLNAVATIEDTYGLYNTDMWADDRGCKIRRTGNPGSYSYLVDEDGDGVEDADWVDRPVNRVSWGDATRFANWLHNGQPTGAQDLSTTEDGSYFLDGAMSSTALLLIEREPDATWVIPSEDEWYKAAYHYNDGVTGNYYDFPAGSGSVPGYIGDGESIPDPDPGNYATYDGDGGDDGIGSPYYRTEVGEHENSDSPYGTFDQGGNVWEWNEAVVIVQHRGVRGGQFASGASSALSAGNRSQHYATDEGRGIGFRVSTVGEPGPIPTVSEWGLIALTLLLLTGMAIKFRRTQRQAA